MEYLTKKAFLVLESGLSFLGLLEGDCESVGEIVFNTSHSGYEEMATDPSYYNQILVTTAPMQGNYGSHDCVWESHRIWIKGFICLQMQNTSRQNTWLKRLNENKIPVLTEIDTRKLVVHLREQGTVLGAIIKEDTVDLAKKKAFLKIEQFKKDKTNWIDHVVTKEAREFKGDIKTGPKVGVIDFGCKKNIIRELQKYTSEVKLFPYTSSFESISKWNPDGLLLSNGPGNPEEVPEACLNMIRHFLGDVFIFGICMGHQVLARALGAKTYKLKFGHRGGNHPIKDLMRDKIYVTSQNHGYAVSKDSLPSGVQITHINLNDQTVSGLCDKKKKCLSVQFHPESSPGPYDSKDLFQYFVNEL